ncbi:hypothetical protein EVAR_49561_1 [Eumeta japonica]|uniref:Retrovirus-related Pol polyprotein from transposon TNT 1-94 n=1 Tax=Eumeta variegata TaxID=151549 RepID=A0A4C1XHY0_EUMVA|nr:hypothetical protein EVAR_49561_1 [Eumeta japonica]
MENLDSPEKLRRSLTSHVKTAMLFFDIDSRPCRDGRCYLASVNDSVSGRRPYRHEDRRYLCRVIGPLKDCRGTTRFGGRQRYVCASLAVDDSSVTGGGVGSLPGVYEIVTGLNDMTPYEVWTGNKPNLSHVRIFGSKVMMHIPKEKRLKWDEKARELILRRIRNMRKKEESSFNDTDIDDEKDITYVPDASSVSDTYDSSDTHSTASESDESIINANQEVTDKRVRKIPGRFGYNHLCITEPENHNVTDITLEEALNGPESKHWRESMEEELESFRKNDAWELVDKPHDSTVVQCKRSGPGSRWLLSDFPPLWADASNTSQNFSGFVGCVTGKWGKYHVLLIVGGVAVISA